MEEWYATYFDEDYLRLYSSYLSKGKDPGEVEGIVRALELEPGTEILDLACGQGRHTVPLAVLGYRMTGLDLSETLLGHARDRAAEAGVDVEWVRADMRSIPWAGRFDAVINMFTAFSYFADER